MTWKSYLVVLGLVSKKHGQLEGGQPLPWVPASWAVKWIPTVSPLHGGGLRHGTGWVGSAEGTEHRVLMLCSSRHCCWHY